MTDFVFDTEFLDYNNLLQGISIGVCAVRHGIIIDEFYAVNASLDDTRVSFGWLGENVWPHLPQVASTQTLGTDRVLDRSHPDVLERDVIHMRLADFFRDNADGQPSRLWAWYGAFDLVVLARFMGGFLSLPGWAQIVWDLKRVHRERGAPDLPEQAGDEHHALADARWNVEVGRVLKVF